ncbi:PD40 domain-containing protein [Olivibacter sp. SDN3]|uniref:amidohydrolase family protein n=1 Tax=Olivibacter sp. SDN3 TaxID=2764720 RepID=UPI001650FE36|nr:amidohydrolase family protein [Olivibacter sp. SDN3]QNL48231.1 PD40 domain-containing protein [Olivibacter sp. SDN3]
MRKYKIWIIRAILIGLSYPGLNTCLYAQETNELPLKGTREVQIDTDEATWLALDVAPDGKTLVFSLLGDLYELPINGGEAKALTSGIAMDVQPKYSPDGKSIAFISDRNGAENVWILDVASGTYEQVTKSTDEYMEGLSWTRDGQYLIVSKGVGIPKLHIVHRNGGAGSALTPEPANMKAIEPAVAVNDSLIWFARRTGMWDYNAQFPQYQLNSYDRVTGKVEVKTSRYGSAFSPTLSPDGQWLVYGTRYDEHTALVLHQLATGEEEVLAHPVQRDDQEALAAMGVLPTMAFTPDSKKLIAAYGGKIQAINLADKKVEQIPFRVKTTLAIGPALDFKFPIEDQDEFMASQIRDLALSPDSKKLAFTVADRLYVMDYPNGKPIRVTNMEQTEAQPAWSPDGHSLAFVTWDGNQGALYTCGVNGKTAPKKLTEQPGLFQEPAWSANGERIVFVAGKAAANRIGTSNTMGGREWIGWIAATGGDIHHIAKAEGSNPHFGEDENRIFLYSNAEGLYSINWSGHDKKQHLKLSGIRTYAFSNDHGGEFQFFRSNAQPSVIKIAPKGNKAFAKISNEIYVVEIPMLGNTVPVIHVADVQQAEFPVKKITEIGCEFPSWNSDGSVIYGALGAVAMRYELGTKLSDSVVFAERKLEIPLKAMHYKGDYLLQGARVLTMKGNEVLEEGDVWVKNNRIERVGKTGTLSVPANTKRVDMSGYTVSPGFIDIHDHGSLPLTLHEKQPTSLALNLAYGVTTTRNPQPHVTDILTYQDKVRTGETLGPRIYSTGPGVGYWGYAIKSLDHARQVLKQYTQYFDTKTLKMYAVGNRKQRQWIIMAAKEQGLLPTTEGNLDFKLGITELLDGYPGHEHAHPITALYNDFTTLSGTAQIAYTPTLLISYGGPNAENYFYTHEDILGDKKIKRLMPKEELDRKIRRRPIWALDEEYLFPQHAKAAKAMAVKGTVVCIGAHSQFQGLGYHWEMWALGAGMEPLDVLKAATINGARAIGLDGDLGSIEPGKLADLVIMEKNPMEDLRHTNTIKYVVKDGQFYNGDDLEKIMPDAL